jgi:hypothetical protein
LREKERQRERERGGILLSAHSCSAQCMIAVSSCYTQRTLFQLLDVNNCDSLNYKDQVKWRSNVCIFVDLERQFCCHCGYNAKASQEIRDYSMARSGWSELENSTICTKFLIQIPDNFLLAPLSEILPFACP